MKVIFFIATVFVTVALSHCELTLEIPKTDEKKVNIDFQITTTTNKKPSCPILELKQIANEFSNDEKSKINNFLEHSLRNFAYSENIKNFYQEILQIVKNPKDASPTERNTTIDLGTKFPITAESLKGLVTKIVGKVLSVFGNGTANNENAAVEETPSNPADYAAGISDVPSYNAESTGEAPVSSLAAPTEYNPLFPTRYYHLIPEETLAPSGTPSTDNSSDEYNPEHTSYSTKSTYTPIQEPSDESEFSYGNPAPTSYNEPNGFNNSYRDMPEQLAEAKEPSTHTNNYDYRPQEPETTVIPSNQQVEEVENYSAEPTHAAPANSFDDNLFNGANDALLNESYTPNLHTNSNPQMIPDSEFSNIPVTEDLPTNLFPSNNQEIENAFEHNVPISQPEEELNSPSTGSESEPINLIGPVSELPAAPAEDDFFSTGVNSESILANPSSPSSIDLPIVENTDVQSEPASPTDLVPELSTTPTRVNNEPSIPSTPSAGDLPTDEKEPELPNAPLSEPETSVTSSTSPELQQFPEDDLSSSSVPAEELNSPLTDSQSEPTITASQGPELPSNQDEDGHLTSPIASPEFENQQELPNLLANLENPSTPFSIPLVERTPEQAVLTSRQPEEEFNSSSTNAQGEPVNLAGPTAELSSEPEVNSTGVNNESVPALLSDTLPSAPTDQNESVPQLESELANSPPNSENLTQNLNNESLPTLPRSGPALESPVVNTIAEPEASTNFFNQINEPIESATVPTLVPSEVNNRVADAFGEPQTSENVPIERKNALSEDAKFGAAIPKSRTTLPSTRRKVPVERRNSRRGRRGRGAPVEVHVNVGRNVEKPVKVIVNGHGQVPKNAYRYNYPTRRQPGKGQPIPTNSESTDVDY